MPSVASAKEGPLSTLSSLESTPSFYATPDRQAQLLAASKLWEGTPFFANSEACGRDGGADCVRLLHAIHHACGAITRIEIPHYAMDHGQHSNRSLLIEAFESWPQLRERFVRVWVATSDSQPAVLIPKLIPGDTLCFLTGKVPHHGGLVHRPGWFFHTLKSVGAHEMQLLAVIRGWRVLGQLAAVYRPLPL